MLTNKQKSYLKGLANSLNPVTQIGKDGVTYNVIESVDDALEAKELIKLNVLKTCPQEINEVAIELASEIYKNSIIIPALGFIFGGFFVVGSDILLGLKFIFLAISSLIPNNKLYKILIVLINSTG